MTPEAATTTTDQSWRAAKLTNTEALERWPLGDVLRDIARGGLAGLLVGVIVAGLGGRVVMRIAALVVPSATGAFTDNGNRIGNITFGGSLGLIVFVGLLAGIIFAVVWVVISPWLPGKGVVRGLVAVPLAVAIGAFGLIDRDNRDFAVLGHDPLVVVSLLALVALVAPAMALADEWLDRRLPYAKSRNSVATSGYLVLTGSGLVLGGLLILQAAGGRESQPLGITTIGAGFVTLAWWYQRIGGRTSPSRVLRIAGGSILILGTVAGYILLIPHVTSALGG